jgi:hypothetical protein
LSTPCDVLLVDELVVQRDEEQAVAERGVRSRGELQV